MENPMDYNEGRKRASRNGHPRGFPLDNFAPACYSTIQLII